MLTFTHEQLLIILAIALIAIIMGLSFSFKAGVKAKSAIETEKLDFARRTGTHIIIRSVGKPLQKVYLLTEQEIANMRTESQGG